MTIRIKTRDIIQEVRLFITRPTVSNDFDSILQMAEAFVDWNTQPDNVFAQDPM